MTKKITLIGCGNVGSRHLQALAKTSFELEVNVVEPDENAKEIAENR